jgi:hypothetical protein
VASTCQFSSAWSVKFSCPFASNKVSTRTPQKASATPRTPPQRRDQNALGQKLPDHAQPPCTHRQPDGHLAPPRGGARQQKIGGIGPGDHQDQADQRQQQKQRLRISEAKAVHPRASRQEDQFRQVGPLSIISGGDRDPLLKHRCNSRLRLAPIHARPQPRHHLKPVGMRIQERFSRRARVQAADIYADTLMLVEKVENLREQRRLEEKLGRLRDSLERRQAVAHESYVLQFIEDFPI